MDSIYAAQLKRIEAIKQLRDVLKKMDPASGLTVHIRRGVAADNPEYDDDQTRRPWVLSELSGAGEHGMDPMRLIVNTLIQQNLESLRFLNMMAKSELKQAQDNMAAVATFLDGEGK
jgi:hypothetical protein